MTDLRQAAQQALEALENVESAMYVTSEGEAVAFDKASEAITTLREALAQPEQRKPLTATSILNMMPSSIPAEYDGPLMEFARAIEQALNERNT